MPDFCFASEYYRVHWWLFIVYCSLFTYSQLMGASDRLFTKRWWELASFSATFSNRLCFGRNRNSWPLSSVACWRLRFDARHFCFRSHQLFTFFLVLFICEIYSITCFCLVWALSNYIFVDIFVVSWIWTYLQVKRFLGFLGLVGFVHTIYQNACAFLRVFVGFRWRNSVFLISPGDKADFYVEFYCHYRACTPILGGRSCIAAADFLAVSSQASGCVSRNVCHEHQISWIICTHDHSNSCVPAIADLLCHLALTLITNNAVG